MAKKSYTVKSTIKHGSGNEKPKFYNPGDKITMDEKEAESYLGNELEGEAKEVKVDDQGSGNDANG